MANTIQLRRSATANAVPTTTQLALGELAINTYDGKLYLKKNVGGVETIVDVTGGGGGASISVSDTAPASPVNGSLWWNSNIGVLKIYYNDGTSNQWVDASHTSASSLTGILGIPNGGTGAATAAGALTALGAYPATNPSGYISSSGSITGNAATATALQTARTINGVSFNGSANITVADDTKLPLAGGTMTGAIAFAAGQTWPTFNQSTTGAAGSLTNNSTYMANRGSVLAANVDTATSNGFYTQTNPADSQGLLVFNSGGSLGPLQMTFTYGGLMQFRNKTDSATWNAWKTVVTNVTGTAPISSSGGATPAISISAATTSAAGSMSSTDKTKLDGIAASANNYVLPKATATALGGVEVFDATVQTVAANAVTATASRTYGVQLNAADQMVVNVPWVDTTNTGTVTSVAGTGTVSGLTLSGTVTSSGSLTLGGTLSLTSGNVTTALGFTPANSSQLAGSVSQTNFDLAKSPGLYHYDGTMTGTPNGRANYRSIEIGSAGRYSQIAMPWDQDGMWFRRQTDSLWSTWREVLHSGNYTSYSPSLTGGGASGSWGISVTGNAANVTGTVAAANGGTGLTSPGASGNVLTSNGSAWVSSAPAGASVSYPQNVQSGNYTLVLADAGKHIYSTNTGAQTLTIPTNASVAFPIGTTVTIVNEGTTNIALSVSGVSVRNNGSNQNLLAPLIAPGQAVQLLKTGTDSWKATFGVILNNVLVTYLVIAGGGSGGGGAQGGGGGAGGYLSGSITTSGTMVVTVGAGGANGTAAGNNGGNSSITGVTAAVGGGAGGKNGSPGAAGGSGGGAGSNYPDANLAGGAGTSGQGNAGGTYVDGANYYQCGGGGGAGAAGGNGTTTLAGPGGYGLSSSITGTSVQRAGGGGGGNIYSAGGGVGGAGGGGTGGKSTTVDATAGTANTGGGGGGAGSNGRPTGAGGSGVVILSVPTAYYSGITTGSPTVTTSGSNTILTFNTSGSYTI